MPQNVQPAPETPQQVAHAAVRARQTLGSSINGRSAYLEQARDLSH